MKKSGKGILFVAASFVAALCFALGGYAVSTGQTGGAVKAFLFALVFTAAAALLHKGFTLPANSKHTEKKQVPQPESKYDYLHFTVAGVTFQNEDGRHRQTILRRMHFGDAPFDNGYSASLEEYDFQGKPAISVTVNGEMIGNVPREAVQAVLSFMDRPGCCVSHIDVYGGGRKKGTNESLSYGAEVILRCNK